MKKIFDKMFGQYRGLRRELYVLFWGKAATNMGAMIWPMLTLILSNKLGMDAGEIAKITISMGIVQFPVNLIGGKLADHCNKKKLIVVCDLVTVICYLTAAFLPVSMTQILLFFTAGVFQTMENPSYDVNSGEILIDGHNLKDFNRMDLRELFGMVLQETWLFHGTIMENIRYGRLDATDEEVIAAAKAAHAHHFIMSQPGGYQMVLNEETSNISQGQKQLLTIARAILADNKILILDEATSSVDTRTEEQIQAAMDNLMRGRTSFVIAHRLSTIRDADLILVMKDGDIIEQGTHESLLAANGFYANLYNSQFEKAEAV